MHILSQLDIEDLTELSAVFSTMSDGAGSMEEAANRIVEYLYTNLVIDDGKEPACALVRLTATVPYAHLEPDYRAFVDEHLQALGRGTSDPDMPCQALLASRGHKRDWNSRHLSRTYKVCPVYGPEVFDEYPDLQHIFAQLGVTYEDLVESDPNKILEMSIRTLSVFFEPEALGSQYVPHQEDFVVPMGIKSKLLAMGILPSGRIFDLILFPTTQISTESASLFAPLTLSLKLALMPFDQGKIFTADSLPQFEQAGTESQMRYLKAQNAIMDELLGVYQNTAQRRTAQLKKALAELDDSASELKRSNDELQQFAYVASHDLQEPLRAITGYLDIVKRRHADVLSKDAQVCIQNAVDGAKRMRNLISDLLKYARVDTRTTNLVPTDCNKLLDDALQNLKVAIEESNATVKRVSLPVVNVDGTQLTQVFQNLIANAIKFRAETSPLISVNVSEEEKKWKFSIGDNGIGFDMAYVDRIFQIFKRLHTRSDYPGTGIGLAVCKKIVERHGGNIWAESEPNKGTTFFFTVPSDLDLS